MSYVYHGSYTEIKNPELKRGRIDVDFGTGFYLTEDKNMALKWASRKDTAVLNSYKLNYDGLNVIKLGLTENWLRFVASCRGESNEKFDLSGVDVIIGPTADDKMFSTLTNYFEGRITAEQAIKYLNVAGFSNQIVLKTEKAISQLEFVRSNTLSKNEKDFIYRVATSERKAASKILADMIEADKQNLTKNNSVLIGDYENEDKSER